MITDSSKLCICCGERPAQWATQTAKHCHECNALVGREPDMSDAWPLLFAVSMARIARRSEVARMGRTIQDALPVCDCGDADCPLTALADLCALALSGCE